MPGFPLHFHFIPVYGWVEDLFWQDERYRVLENFAAAISPQSLTDGAEMTLFIWREFGESPTPPATQRPSVHETIERLREAFEEKSATPAELGHDSSTHFKSIHWLLKA